MKRVLLCFLLICGCLYAENTNPYVSNKVYKQVEPYLMPDDHPAKAKLDEIFTKSRALLSLKTMKKAGFTNVVPQPFTHIVVTKHPELQGYVVKAYLDAHRYYKNKPEYHYYICRAEGAKRIQDFLNEKGWNDQFKAPRKWIYMLPAEPSPPDEVIRKNFILVEDDMDICNEKENATMWKSEIVTTDFLDKFYTILEELGLSDCAKIKNAPFSRDGRVAFVDTQTYNSWPVSYYNMDDWLTKEMRSYWRKLTK